MTAVETPPPAPETRALPALRRRADGQQEWCLDCGADVSSHDRGAAELARPGALVGVLLAIAAVALVLALVELAGDAEQVAEQPAATPTPTPTRRADRARPGVHDDPAGHRQTEPGTTPEIADWPAGKDAWTVVLESSATRSAAEARANELASQGVPVGILDSDDYSSLEPGRFVVFSGQYDSQRAADQALQDLSGQVDGALRAPRRAEQPTARAPRRHRRDPVSPTTTPDP